MITSAALMISYLALATSIPHANVKPATAPIVIDMAQPQSDLAPDETENLQAEIDAPGAPAISPEFETPREWKKRMVRPCTRVGNRVTC